MKRTLRRLVPPIVFLGLVALFPGVALTAVALAGGILLAFGVLAALSARAMKRMTEKVLADQPHLNRLGETFEHHFDGARVLGVDRDTDGRVHLQVAWDDQQTVHLDKHGMPDAMSHEGPGSATWVLPPTELGAAELATLHDLPDVGIRVTERGLVMLSGEAVQQRRLVSSNGIDLQIQCAVPAL